METAKRPYLEDDVLSSSIYETAREVDRILNKCSVQDHSAILGMIQVTGQRRAYEYQARQQKQMQDAQAEAQSRQAQARFAVQ